MGAGSRGRRQKLINEYLETTFDTIGLLLCIRLNFLHQRRMQANRVPCLDTHLNSLLLLFWPKYGSVQPGRDPAASLNPWWRWCPTEIQAADDDGPPHQQHQNGHARLAGTG